MSDWHEEDDSWFSGKQSSRESTSNVGVSLGDFKSL